MFTKTFTKTSLIAAALSLALAGGANAQSGREDIHRAWEGDQYDLLTPQPAPPPAPAKAHKLPAETGFSGLTGNLYMTTRPPVRQDDAMFDRAKGWAAEAN